MSFPLSLTVSSISIMFVLLCQLSFWLQNTNLDWLPVLSQSSEEHYIVMKYWWIKFSLIAELSLPALPLKPPRKVAATASPPDPKRTNLKKERGTALQTIPTPSAIPLNSPTSSSCLGPSTPCLGTLLKQGRRVQLQTPPILNPTPPKQRKLMPLPNDDSPTLPYFPRRVEELKAEDLMLEVRIILRLNSLINLLFSA